MFNAVQTSTPLFTTNKAPGQRTHVSDVHSDIGRGNTRKSRAKPPRPEGNKTDNVRYEQRCLRTRRIRPGEYRVPAGAARVDGVRFHERQPPRIDGDTGELTAACSNALRDRYRQVKN